MSAELTDRQALGECGICGAAAGERCDYGGEHVGRRWKVGLTSPGADFSTPELGPDGGCCRPTVETNHVLLDRQVLEAGRSDRCGSVIYRSAGLGCGWHGPVRDGENVAVEDTHDHAAPGWRDLPPVPRHPSSSGDQGGKVAEKAHEVWLDKMARLYAAHGVDARWLPGTGAPIRTYRTKHGTRSHWSSPVGGYDISAGIAGIEPEHVAYSPQLSVFG